MVKSLTQWVETYSAAMKCAERYGNTHGDIDAANHAWHKCKEFQDKIAELESQLAELKKQKPIGYVSPDVIKNLIAGTRYGGARITPRPDEEDGTTAAIYAAPVVQPDFFPDACRLALELECLLLSCNDNAAVSKWWDSAHEALEQHRAMIAAAQEE